MFKHSNKLPPPMTFTAYGDWPLELDKKFVVVGLHVIYLSTVRTPAALLTSNLKSAGNTSGMTLQTLSPVGPPASRDNHNPCNNSAHATHRKNPLPPIIEQDAKQVCGNSSPESPEMVAEINDAPSNTLVEDHIRVTPDTIGAIGMDLQLKTPRLNMGRSKTITGEVREPISQKHLDVLLLQEPYVQRHRTGYEVIGLGNGTRITAIRDERPWSAVAVTSPNIALLFISQLSTQHCVCAEVQAPGSSFYIVSHYFQYSDEIEEHLRHLESFVQGVINTLKREGRKTTKVRDTARVLLSTHVPDDCVSEDMPEQQAVRNISRNVPEAADAPLFTKEEVARVIRSLKNGKAPEPDLIEVCVLKRAFAAIPFQFVDLFNRCLQWSIFPFIWKEGSLRTLFKGDNKDAEDPKSYRPICLLSIIGKVLERLLKLRLNETSLAPGKLSDKQFGFVSGR
ncbi:uncharacterized protein LOC118447918 [Vespa mandarinia]|uniref:uncharacterized protein LOC118447918 n=1 Tax=Vespa mandarinia TaxID=7446 RepID=UPI001610A646|nr:uncharacterized protein LOC118447918 [Vespa mandarinia]